MVTMVQTRGGSTASCRARLGYSSSFLLNGSNGAPFAMAVSEHLCDGRYDHLCLLVDAYVLARCSQVSSTCHPWCSEVRQRMVQAGMGTRGPVHLAIDLPLCVPICMVLAAAPHDGHVLCCLGHPVLSSFMPAHRYGSSALAYFMPAVVDAPRGASWP
jgi:hypothetical protein